MKITHVFAQNFCKFYGKDTLDTDFSMKTVLSGQNEVGKSTVKRIILDVLNCHDENDREITGIRPHDENGVEIDDVDIVRAVAFEIDGKAKTLKKITRQKRNKKGEIVGSVTDYSINDVPYKMADYNQYINDNMAELGVLPFCLNAMTLLNKSQAEQRLALARDKRKNVMTYIDDESTICRCTGLKDKNGKLIWENDIVKINNSKGNVLITFGDFEIICTIPNEKYYKHRLEYDTEYEVVGNIFDNAELLESEG